MSRLSLGSLIWHNTRRLLLSWRGLLAVAVPALILSVTVYLYDSFPETIFAIIDLMVNRDPNLRFLWFFFDNIMSKVVTILVAPLFIFDAIAGERSQARLGLYLSKSLGRGTYALSKAASAWLAFGIVFVPIVLLGYPVFLSKITSLTAEGYFATSSLLFLLAGFAVSLGLFISVLSRNSLISFLGIWGVMALLLIPNASRFTWTVFEDVARFTPHFYSTYFTTNVWDGLWFVGCVLLILAFSLLFLVLAVWKLKREDV